MELTVTDRGQFFATLRGLSAEAILASAAEIEQQAATVTGEMDWWQATVEIDRLCRVRHAGRQAAMASAEAASAVRRAAVRAGLAVDDARVTTVARAAADVARGLVVDTDVADRLLQGWARLSAA